MKIQISNDPHGGQYTICIPKMLPDEFLLFLSSTPAMYSKFLKRSGKRVAQDGGQEDSCGELKLQTKAYLQVPKPRGWKRNPPSVIVSHVLLPPCNIFQSKTHSFILYSNDKTFTGKEKQRNHTRAIAFYAYYT